MRTFPSDGFEVLSGCSPYRDESAGKRCSPLARHRALFATKGRSCIFQGGVWAQRPHLLAQEPQADFLLPHQFLNMSSC